MYIPFRRHGVPLFQLGCQHPLWLMLQAYVQWTSHHDGGLLPMMREFAVFNVLGQKIA